MANDITGFGLVATVVASTTFPVGFPVTQFADDSDPVDFASIKIADTAMGLNGDLISWARAVPIPIVLNVIAGSEDDLNLQILADANRPTQGKTSSYDSITITLVYPDGSIATYTGGVITDYSAGKSVASSGRLKTRSYAFSFEQKIGA